MKKMVFDIGFVIYIIITIFVTVCLLAYNDYKVSEFGDVSLVVLKEEVGNYNKKDLLIITKSNIEDLKKGTQVFYYDSKDSKVSINIGTIKEIEKVSDNEYTLNFKDGSYVSNDYLIGAEENAINLGFLGNILGILESKVGYLLIIVLPMFLTFLYELYAIIKEIRTKK